MADSLVALAVIRELANEFLKLSGIIPVHQDLKLLALYCEIARSKFGILTVKSFAREWFPMMAIQ
jgi:hypothetical protein